METLRKAVAGIAYAQDHANLSALQRSLIPFLSLASSVYKLGLSSRHYLYHYNIFRRHRLPVPVISVGNLTWGGNGKTPMVEFIARWLAESGLSSLILNRGYACGDEAKMLQRHLLGRPVKVGTGANRAATAAAYFERYGSIDPQSRISDEKHSLTQVGVLNDSEKIGAVILDDGMQHLSLHRDVEIVMVNGLTLWGNCHLLPFGPLREPLAALERADVAVVHHADLVSDQALKDIRLMLLGVKESLEIVFTRMAPSHFFKVGSIDTRVPLQALSNSVVLCVSAIGSPDSFVQAIQKIGAFYLDRLDFSDHHIFQNRDITMIRAKLGRLEENLCSRPVVVVTEKDYDRDLEILRRLYPYDVMVLCSELQIMTPHGCTGISLKNLLEKSLRIRIEQLA